MLSSIAALPRRSRASGSRVDSSGKAQLQEYIQRFTLSLNAEIERLLPSNLQPLGQHVQWLSALDSVRYGISPSTDFVRAAGLADQPSLLENCWSQLGLCWDGVGLLGHSRSRPQGVLLVEARSQIEESGGPGCCAPACSTPLVLDTFRETREWLEAHETEDWTGALYRTANRLAHLHMLRNHLGIPAWLVQVYFVNDPDEPASRADWLPIIAGVNARLGLSRRPPFTLDVFLPALNPA